MRLRARDPEELLVAWLNELNYLLTCERTLPAAASFERAGPRALSARLRLVPLEEAGAALQREVKSATYHGLRVLRVRGRLRATVTLDV